VELVSKVSETVPVSTFTANVMSEGATDCLLCGYVQPRPPGHRSVIKEEEAVSETSYTNIFTFHIARADFSTSEAHNHLE
jgi:hypothetical protein